jgi:hypothetical protein
MGAVFDSGGDSWGGWVFFLPLAKSRTSVQSLGYPINHSQNCGFKLPPTMLLMLGSFLCASLGAFVSLAR